LHVLAYAPFAHKTLTVKYILEASNEFPFKVLLFLWKPNARMPKRPNAPLNSKECNLKRCMPKMQVLLLPSILTASLSRARNAASTPSLESATLTLWQKWSLGEWNYKKQAKKSLL
jgi:hypothetical protein